MPDSVVLVYGSIASILFILLIIFIVQRIKNKRLEDFEDRDY